MNSSKVFLIAGSGRSGSTLLAIILGKHKDCVPVGELLNLIDNGVFNKEYCSCSKPVSNCDFWMKVIQTWNKSRNLSLEEYNRIQQSVTRNKGTFTLLKNSFFPSTQFKQYLEDTHSLYQSITTVSNKKYIVDTSKIAQRIIVLKKSKVDFCTVHLTRKFSSVLNSNKKQFKKDLKAGLEKDMGPEKTSYVLITWLLNNFLVKLFSLGNEKIRIRYENIINNLEGEIRKIISPDQDFIAALKNRGPFLPLHIVAGNRVRMKREVYVANSTGGSDLKNLSFFDKKIGALLDLFF